MLPLPRLCLEGAGAILLDAAEGRFSDAVQARIWQVATALPQAISIGEAVPGMNNLMVVFDPLAIDSQLVERTILDLWQAPAEEQQAGEIHDVPVTYGGDAGPDLETFAAAKSLSPEAVIRMHSAPVYSVAAVGAMPGFVYLSGLDPLLAAPRLPNPRQGVPKGSVIIGGAQAGIMPVTAPSGWHMLGRTDLDLFDPHRGRPALFSPGDRIRFVPVVGR